MKLICKVCKCEFESAKSWATMCYHCYRIFKAGSSTQVVTEYINIEDADGQWLRNNIKDILLLCHPDKHGNCARSTRITQKLIEIFQQ